MDTHIYIYIYIYLLYVVHVTSGRARNPCHNPPGQDGTKTTAIMTPDLISGNVPGCAMVFAEATSVLPLIVSDAYHKGNWKKRTRKNFSKIFE